MNDTENLPTTEAQSQNAPAIKVLAELDESEIIALFLQKCRDRAIQIPQPTPNLTDILEAVGQHLQFHRGRPIVEFPDGDKQWRAIQSDLSALHSSIEKILLHKISARFAPRNETRSDQNPEAEPLQSGHSTGQPPVNGRSARGHSPDGQRSIGDQAAPESDQHPDEHDLDEEELEDEDEDKMKETRAKYLAQLWRERASRSPLDDLSPERQKELFELLQEHPKTIAPRAPRAQRALPIRPNCPRVDSWRPLRTPP